MQANSTNKCPKTTVRKRDSFRSKRGFIISCVGSAVGMGNIWLFPTRISAYGGATFLIVYLVFVILIAASGLIEEMAFGRAMRGGPIDAFGKATKAHWKNARIGIVFGCLPVANSLAMAIGYSVVVAWIICYTFGSITGSFSGVQGADAYATCFNNIAADNTVWLIITVVFTMIVLILGVGGGIEKANKIMIPLFYTLFIGLAIYVFTLPGATRGYQYIFVLDPAGLADPLVWIYALGQAFFSLSIAGSGTLIYGSYLSDTTNVANSAKYVAIFDTCAAMLASLVIIPAMAVADQKLTQGGPGLMFIYLPNLFATIPNGDLFMVVFFFAVLFAGLTSLLNLFETPIATVQEVFGANRTVACVIVGIISLGTSLAISPIVSKWMDICSVYLCPIGAALAAIMFLWVMKKDWVLKQVNKGRDNPVGSWFYPLAKYVLPVATIVVLVAGSVLGGIG